MGSGELLNQSIDSSLAGPFQRDPFPEIFKASSPVQAK